MAIDVVDLPSGALVLWLHTSHDPDAAEWDSTLTDLGGRLSADRIDMDRLGSLVLSDGGAPNAKQRLMIGEKIWRGRKPPVSIITTRLDDPVKRGIAKALRWVNPRTSFFAPAQLRDALAHIGALEETAAVWDAVERLQRKLPPLDVVATARSRVVAAIAEGAWCRATHLSASDAGPP
jgi:hypothetical protein